jgi:hypothetical protein
LWCSAMHLHHNCVPLLLNSMLVSDPAGLLYDRADLLNIIMRGKNVK